MKISQTMISFNYSVTVAETNSVNKRFIRWQNQLGDVLDFTKMFKSVSEQHIIFIAHVDSSAQLYLRNLCSLHVTTENSTRKCPFLMN